MSITSVPAGGSAIAPRFATNVTDAELDTIRALFDVWSRKYPRNLLRSAYRDMKVRIKPTGNIPAEAIARIEAVADWPEKAVSALAERSVFEGFTSPGGEQDPFDLGPLLDANRFDLELPQAITSMYTHACSFITTAKGDTRSGEPDVLIMARSAEWSAAIWDNRRRVVKAAMAITDYDANIASPTAVDVYLPDVVLLMTRRPSGAWVADRRENPLGEVLVEPLAYDPQLDRPFGRSRISRAVMNITDRALLTIVRSEIASDFYAAPRMFALGVTQDAFSRGKWQAAIDRWFAITKDEDGDTPTVGQFPQMTMQPLNDHYRTIATQFSGATGVPVANLGIITENPPSAEAIYADDRRLVNIARRQNRVMASSLKRVAQRTVRLRDGSSVPDDLAKIDVSWSNPAFTSPATSADALVKLSTVFPWLSESEVALEFAGFSHAEITRLLADKRRAEGGGILNRLLEREAGAEVAPSGDDAQTLKAKADAMGILIRAGVDPDDAAARVGLAGTQFTGAVPVSLRLPERDATILEKG